MRPRHFLPLLLLLLGMVPSIMAQDATMLARVGWHPLPDSLYTIWKLDRDQVRRLMAIEEDYATDRAEVMRSALEAAERESRLRAMAAERSAEIRAVIHSRHHADWERRVGKAGAAPR